MRHLMDVVKVKKRLVIGQQDIRSLRLSEAFVADRRDRASPMPETDDEKNQPVNRRVRCLVIFAEKEALDQRDDRGKKQRGQKNDDQDERPERNGVEQKSLPRRAHEIGHDNGGNYAGCDRSEIGFIGELASAAVIADCAEGHDRHEKKQIHQQHDVFLRKRGGKARDTLVVFPEQCAAAADAAEERINDRRAQAYAQITEDQRGRERIAQSRGDLDELRRDKHDHHLKRLNQHDGERAEQSPGAQQLLRAREIAADLQLEEGDQNILQKKDVQQQDEQKEAENKNRLGPVCFLSVFISRRSDLLPLCKEPLRNCASNPVRSKPGTAGQKARIRRG